MTRKTLAVVLTTMLGVGSALVAGRLFAQQVGALLKDIGIYTETPIRGKPFYALKQDTLFPSDGRATIYTEWLLPQPGHYTVRYQIYGPSGALYTANSHPFDASEQTWPTWFTFALPKGEKAKALAGRWKVEVVLNAERLATLRFELVDRDRRTETDLSIAVFPFLVEDEAKGADPALTADRAEILNAFVSNVASELQRLFPRVVRPPQSRTLLGEEFTPADAENPGRLFRIRQRLGAEIAIAGRVVIPSSGTTKASLEVVIVNLGTGMVERFRASVSEGKPVVTPKDLMEELTLGLFIQPAFLSSLRAQVGGSARGAQSGPTPGAGPSATADRPPSSPLPAKGTKSIPEIVKEQADGVVFLRVVTKDGERRLGSGFVVRKTGEILTNFHLVEGARTVTVKLRDEDVYEEVTLLETDARRDVALIKVRGWNLPVVRLGNSDLVEVGERVVAIGNPRGLEQTVADGLISAIRDTGKGYKLFQMSVPISTGSSGGRSLTCPGRRSGSPPPIWRGARI